jgi:hypothetical protein
MCKQILGIWNLDPDDTKSQQIYGNISIEFKDSGDMIYVIHLTNSKNQKIFMTYEVENNLLITNQVSSPQKEETEFIVLPNGKLELYFEGIKSTYVKVN